MLLYRVSCCVHLLKDSMSRQLISLFMEESFQTGQFFASVISASTYEQFSQISIKLLHSSD